jgi:chromosome segregation ATPase
MAKIDIGALKKFQELWAPVLETIPAVVEMTAHRDDLARGIAQEETRLAKLQEEIASNVGQSEALLAKLRLEIEEIANKRNAALDAYRADKQAAADEVTEAKKQAAADAKVIKSKTAALEAAYEKAKAEHESKLAALQTAHAERIESLEDEVKGVETRKKVAEKALDALRAKLG